MKWTLIVLSCAVPGSLSAGELRDIELRRLFEPTPAELKAERAGQIFIYEGLRDVDVDRAMNEQFERIESMMFIRIKVTDHKGEVRRNPETGSVIVQDDGC